MMQPPETEQSTIVSWFESSQNSSIAPTQVPSFVIVPQAAVVPAKSAGLDVAKSDELAVAKSAGRSDEKSGEVEPKSSEPLLVLSPLAVLGFALGALEGATGVQA